MNEFSFLQDQQNDLILQDITHLQDALNDLNLESPLMFGVDASMDHESLKSAKALLEEAVEKALKEEAEEAARLRRLKRPPCYIGPYANNICTICGKRQPS